MVRDTVADSAINLLLARLIDLYTDSKSSMPFADFIGRLYLGFGLSTEITTGVRKGMDEDILLTEFADMLGIQVSLLLQWGSGGSLPSTDGVCHIGRLLRLPCHEIERLIATTQKERQERWATSGERTKNQKPTPFPRYFPSVDTSNTQRRKHSEQEPSSVRRLSNKQIVNRRWRRRARYLAAALSSIDKMPDCLEAIAKRAAVDIVDVERILSGQTPTSLVLDCAEKELLEENWLARDTRHEVHLKLDALKHLAASES